MCIINCKTFLMSKYGNVHPTIVTILMGKGFMVNTWLT